jgi:hypothetical protein
MAKRMDDHVKAHQLTPEEGTALKDSLALMKPPSNGNPGLTPEQRGAIVNVLAMESQTTGLS